MRMSRRLALFSGAKKALCYFCGALNETLTLSQDGITVATVTTNANGKTDTAIELKTGKYTVLGSVSKFSRSVIIKDDGTYNAYPDGAVFWYGNGDSANDTLYSVCGGFSERAGYVPSGTSGAAGYSTSNSAGATHYTHSNSIPSSSGSTYGNSVFSGKSFSLEGYTAVKCVIAGSTSKGGWGCPTSVSHGWSPWQYCQSGSAVTQSMDVTGRSSGMFAMSLFNMNRNNSGSVTVYAIWREGEAGEDDSSDTTPTERLAGTNSLNVLTGTYRYTTANTANPWLTAGSYSTDNYVGANSSELNTALIPVGSFNFTGTSSRLQISLYGYCPSINFNNKGFKWAICSSDANKTAYQTTGSVTDSTQLASGTAKLYYNNGSYTTYTLDLAADSLPSGTPLYLYFWPNASSDVGHFRGTLTASLYYYA